MKTVALWALVAINLMLLSVQANRLTDGEDMPLIEGVIECGPAMSRGAERNPLCRNRGVRPLCVVGRDESGNVYQHPCFGRLSGIWAYFHNDSSNTLGIISARFPSMG